MQRLLTADGKVGRVFFFSIFLCVAIMPSIFPSAVWADAKSVAAAINSYASGDIKAVVSENSVTVTGTKSNAKTSLSLDISGVTVVWNARLEGNFKTALPKNALLFLSGRGIFNVSSGGVICNNTASGVAAVELRNGAELVVNGTVKAEGNHASAIYSRHGKVTVEKGGKVQSPHGSAIRTYAYEGDIPELSAVKLNDKTGLSGEVALVEDGRCISTFYGTAVIDSENVFYGDKNKRPLIVIAEKAEVVLTHNTRFTEGAGVDMEIRKGGILLSDASVILKGTLKNEGRIFNSGTFTNKGTLTNKGTIINRGTIVNDEKIVNEGTLDTTEGKVVNNGLIDNTHGEIEGRKNISGRGRIVNPYSESGGCSTGLGFAEFAALVGVLKLGYSHRKKERK